MCSSVPVHACDFDLPSDAAALAASDAVFSGTVVADVPSADGTLQPYDRAVETLYKGLVGPVSPVWAPRKDCVFVFRKGERYLVFASGTPRTAALCAGTRALAPGAEPSVAAIAGCAFAVGPALAAAGRAATRGAPRMLQAQAP